MDNGMFNVLATSSLHTLLMACLAFVLMWLVLKMLDRASGRPFKRSFEVINDEARALGIYYGLRFLGACIFFGLAFS